jgi:hypothetical protein
MGIKPDVFSGRRAPPPGQHAGIVSSRAENKAPILLVELRAETAAGAACQTLYICRPLECGIKHAADQW